MTHIIETKRLVLRPLKASDAGLITLYTKDPRVAQMTRSIPHPNPPGAVEAYIEGVLAGTSGEVVWAIDHRGSSEEQLIGLIGLKTEGGEIGYWLGAPFWDTGFATEAVQALVADAQRTGWPRLAGEVFQDNPASARVLTKAGFAYAGETQSYCVARQRTVDVWRYELEFARCSQSA